MIELIPALPDDLVGAVAQGVGVEVDVVDLAHEAEAAARATA